MLNHNILTFMLGIFLSGFVSAETNLVKFYEDENRYYLIPPEKIQVFDFDKKDKELVVSIDAHAGSVWRMTIEDISEKELLELTDEIYSKERKNILSVKIDSIN